jgi:uncharacterized protein (TIGR02246 family)
MKNLTVIFTFLALFSLPAFGNDSPEALQDAFAKALAASDADAIAACYAANAISFPVDSMVDIGPGSVRESWRSFFAQYTVKHVKLTDTHMETFGDTAAAWGLFELMVVPVAGGDAIEMRGRFTDVSKNIDGNWLYIADHASVPALPEE